MDGPRILRRVNLVHQMLERVAVETAAGVHGQRSWLMNDENGFIFMEHANVCGYVRFDGGREDLDHALATTHDVVFAAHGTAVVFKASRIAAGFPLGRGNLRKEFDESLQ